ncbi:TIGR03826 family flagellar region protein [Halobacillus amylolyticus]|uniref:Flagellar protein YvyF n=1 Tax=Halobacillus amylolyticus TaxID=2932259 RepID=A0ABY4HB95_9BACI|nr:TIGR03826 family flagellar region protein [Halobacillus amylolyticus]UOR11668.1 flagellar protein YvyF [Halobacillus amylolyticus]
MMAELANCPRCHGLFMKGSASVCQNCLKQEERDFQTVYAFMRKKQNRTANVMEIVEGTGVDEVTIRGFVKVKRLHPAQFPEVTYDCEKCGAQIRDGRLCESCTNEIQDGVRKQEELEQLGERNRKDDMGRVTYYSAKQDND